jgi:hypothetical protein
METRAVTSIPVYVPEPMEAGPLGAASAEATSAGQRAANVAGAGKAASAAKVKASAGKAATKAASSTASTTSTARPVPARVVASGPGQVTVPTKGYATTTSAKTAKTTAAKTTAAKTTAAKTTAAKTTAAKTTAAKTTAAKTTTAAKATGDYAFLSDSSLSAQDKLLLFLALQKKTANKELETMLDKAAAQKEAAAKSGGGLFGGVTKLFDVAKVVVPALGMADKLLGGKLDDILKQVSGPMLGAAATALGMPALAPIAMSMGPKLLGAVLDATVPGAEKTSSSTTSSSAKKGGELDEVELARVQMLQKRVEEWTSMISNLMQSFHQSRMNVIQNLR